MAWHTALLQSRPAPMCFSVAQLPAVGPQGPQRGVPRSLAFLRGFDDDLILGSPALHWAWDFLFLQLLGKGALADKRMEKMLPPFSEGLRPSTRITARMHSFTSPTPSLCFIPQSLF